MFNCFDCGGSTDFAKMQDQEKVHCVSSQMNEVPLNNQTTTTNEYYTPLNELDQIHQTN